MTCSHDDRLLDLVLGELPPEEAAELRAAAEACPDCQASLAQLEMGATLASRMPLEDGPTALDAIIMAAAEEKAAAMAAERAKAPVGAVPAAPEGADTPTAAAGTSLLDKIKAWIGGITLGPQLAMASVMVLVVSIGLWYLPRLDGSDTVARTQVTPDPEGEAISTLPERSDDAIREAEEVEGLEDSLDREAPQVALNVEADEDAEGSNAPQAFEPPAEAPGASSGYRGNRGLRDRSSADGRSTKRPTPEPAPTREAPPEAERQARAQARQAPIEGSARLPSFGDEERSGSSSSSYGQGASSYRGGRFEEAAEEEPEAEADAPRNAGPSAAPAPQQDVVPSAVHRLARSYRARGECRQAVVHYEDLLRRFPSYGQAPQAMLEAADCQRRLGRFRQARSLLERAQRFASTQAAATRELRRIETLQRAQRRRAPAPSAADSFEAAEAY